MNLQTKKILGINVTTSSKEEILEEIKKYLGKTRNLKPETRNNTLKPLLIFTPNPEIISYAQDDDNFSRIVNTAQINLPDGAGVVWAAEKLHGLKIERIAGIDFIENLVNLAAKQRLTIGLIGGRGDLAVVVRECLLRKYKNLQAEVFEAPEVEIQNSKFKIQNYNLKSKIIDKIIDKKIDILFVALGFPKQEYFIECVKREALSVKFDRPLVLMAVGGSFDYIAGRVPRAPAFIRNLGLEWLFRLLREPWRLPRQVAGARFFIDVLTSRYLHF